MLQKGAPEFLVCLPILTACDWDKANSTFILHCYKCHRKMCVTFLAQPFKSELFFVAPAILFRLVWRRHPVTSFRECEKYREGPLPPSTLYLQPLCIKFDKFVCCLHAYFKGRKKKEERCGQHGGRDRYTCVRQAKRDPSGNNGTARLPKKGTAPYRSGQPNAGLATGCGDGCSETSRSGTSHNKCLH